VYRNRWNHETHACLGFIRFLRRAEFIKEQKELEEHQRARRASVETLQDSMVYVYDEIIRVVRPFMEERVWARQRDTP